MLSCIKIPYFDFFLGLNSIKARPQWLLDLLIWFYLLYVVEDSKITFKNFLTHIDSSIHET